MHLPTTLHARAFSLLEVLIAMTILVSMMMVLIQFLAASQRMWELSAANVRISENSRVAFEVLERDLRSAITSTIPDKQIGFWISDDYVPAQASKAQVCTFVSSAELFDDAMSRLCEISYKFHTEMGASGTLVPPPFVFARQITCDMDDGNWDFTGRPSNWHLNTASSSDLALFETVVPGVESFTMVFYREDETLLVGGDYNEIPFRVEANLVLFDERLTDMPATVRFRTQRSFTKVLFLGDLQTN